MVMCQRALARAFLTNALPSRRNSEIAPSIGVAVGAVRPLPCWRKNCSTFCRSDDSGAAIAFDALAFLADARAIFINGEIFTIIWVPRWAVGNRCCLQTAALPNDAPSHIFGRSNGFKMHRIHARTNSAKVVNLKGIWYWSDEKLVTKSVSKALLPIKEKLAITIAIAMRAPEPTPTVWLWDIFFFKTRKFALQLTDQKRCCST